MNILPDITERNVCCKVGRGGSELGEMERNGCIFELKRLGMRLKAPLRLMGNPWI